MATCLLILLSVTLTQAVQETPKYHVHDLVIVNDTDSHDCECVGICLGHNGESTKVGFFEHFETSDLVHVSYNCIDIPTKTVRAFKVKKTRWMRQATLENVRVYEPYLWFIDDHEDQSINRRRCIQNLKKLLLGLLAHNFGLNGLYNFVNIFMELSDLDEFYQKYLRLAPRSFASSAIVNTVKAGDLVKIEALKPQKNRSLQIRAQHFDGSFGEIRTFLSGNLFRKNSRNQPEFAIQSLFEKNMALGLRPKYLCKITKIHVHRIGEDLTFREFAKYRTFWRDGRNEVLFLQFVKNIDGTTGILPMEYESCHRMNYLLFELCNKGSNSMVIDRAVSSFFLVFRGDAPFESMTRSDIVAAETDMINLLFCTDKALWERALDTMNADLSVRERPFIDGIGVLMNKHYAKIANISEAQSMRAVLSGNQAFNQFHSEWSNKIRQIFQHSMALCVSLLNVVRMEQMQLVSELHPDYKSLFESWAADAVCVKKSNDRMTAMQRLSVIHHYLKANANGHDLHVICYADEEHGYLRNLTSALSERINVEWDINNLNVSQMMANKIVIES